MNSITKYIHYSFYIVILATAQELIAMDSIYRAMGIYEPKWFDAIHICKVAPTIHNIEAVKKLCSKVNINVQDKDGCTALMIASSHGCMNIVQLLLQMPTINVNAQNKNGETALILASEGNQNIVRLLLQHPKINMNIQDDTGSTALIVASKYGHEDIIQLLFEAGGLECPSAIPSKLGNKSINVNLYDQQGYTALKWAIFYNYENTIKLLLKHADINTRARVGNWLTAAMVAAGSQHMSAANYGNIVKLLLQKPGIKIDMMSRKGNTAFHIAAQSGNHIMIKFLLQIPGIDVNIKNRNLETPLILAARCGCEESVKLLLKVPEININAKNVIGTTALWYACHTENTNILKLLLEFPDIEFHSIYGVKLNDQNENLITNKIDELIKKAAVAIAKNDIDTVKSIAKQVWLDSAIDEQGNTLLHKACQQDAMDIAIFLLQNVSDPIEFLLTNNKQGLMPFELVSPSSRFFELILNLAYPNNANNLSKLSTSAMGLDGVPDTLKHITKMNSCTVCSSPFAPTSLSELRRAGKASDFAEGFAGLMTADGTVYSLKQSTKVSLCGYCSKEATNFCSRCKAVYYCSEKCQKADWKNHKQSCQQASDI